MWQQMESEGAIGQPRSFVRRDVEGELSECGGGFRASESPRRPVEIFSYWGRRAYAMRAGTRMRNSAPVSNRPAQACLDATHGEGLTPSNKVGWFMIRESGPPSKLSGPNVRTGGR